MKKHQKESLSPERKRCKRNHSRSIISPHRVKKHQKESLSPERKRCKRSHSRSIISPHDVKKHQKESLSPERKRLQRSRLQSVISSLGHDSRKCCKSKSRERPSEKTSQSPKLSLNSLLNRSQSGSPKNLGHTKSKESAHLAIKSSQEDSSVKRSWSQSPKHVGHTGS